jgi:hypothetical protein
VTTAPPSLSPTGAIGPPSAQRGRRVAAIALIFVAAGPIIASVIGIGLITLVYAATHGVGSPGALAQLLQSAVVFVAIAAIAGYTVGLVPAAAAGLMKEAYFGGAGWPFALVVGILAGLSPELVRFGPWAHGWYLLPPDAYRYNLMIFCITCVLTTLICRWMTQWFFVRPGRMVAT